MASDVGIVNSALIKIGESTITSLTEDSKPARIANQIYAQMRDAVTRAHPWNFATERVALAQLTTTPAFGYNYEFSLPADCLRVVRMSEHDYEFKIEGNKLRTDHDSAKILYIKRVTDPNQFDTLFVEAFSARLALEFAFILAENVSLAEVMNTLYRQKLREARGMDGQEGFADELIADTWINVRY